MFQLLTKWGDLRFFPHSIPLSEFFMFLFICCLNISTFAFFLFLDFRILHFCCIFSCYWFTYAVRKWREKKPVKKRLTTECRVNRRLSNTELWTRRQSRWRLAESITPLEEFMVIGVKVIHKKPTSTVYVYIVNRHLADWSDSCLRKAILKVTLLSIHYNRMSLLTAIYWVN